MENNMNLKKGEGESENNPEGTSSLHKPKHIFRKNIKNDPLRSKSAPAEEFDDKEETDDYLSSYNYFIYYNSIKPVDPRMPKPTYKPKPNLDFIKESKDKEEEDEDQHEIDNDNINRIESLTKEINQLSIEPSLNPPNNGQDLFGKNVFNDNGMNTSEKNQNAKNNLNEVPSPFDYYTQSMNAPSLQNNTSQQQVWNESLGMNPMGMGMYNPGLSGMASPGMNQLNSQLGVNIGINPFTNLPQYGNTIGMNPSLINSNARINSGIEQNNLGRKAPNEKKGNNRA